MNIIGEYSIEYTIYTMFNTYPVKITNQNLITNSGYDFFLRKWYQDNDEYPIQFGYYYDGDFYNQHNVDDTYDVKLSNNDGTYDENVNYIDRDTNKQYKFDGENFVEFYEKLDKICIGRCSYSNENTTKPSEYDTELYNPSKECKIDDFVLKTRELVMKYEIEKEYLDGTTEIGVKTNHGRLVSHDIHAPYNLPFGTNIILEYVFKLQ